MNIQHTRAYPHTNTCRRTPYGHIHTAATAAGATAVLLLLLLLLLLLVHARFAALRQTQMVYLPDCIALNGIF